MMMLVAAIHRKMRRDIFVDCLNSKLFFYNILAAQNSRVFSSLFCCFSRKNEKRDDDDDDDDDHDHDHDAYDYGDDDDDHDHDVDDADAPAKLRNTPQNPLQIPYSEKLGFRPPRRG